jgi:hypothetical protein
MWFTVNLLFKSNHPEHPENEFLWEERMFLVHAETEEEARREAERIGKAEEHEHVAANRDLVRWTLERIESVCAIDAETIKHGTEVFSRFLSDTEVASISTGFPE